MTRIACVQANVLFGDSEANAEKAIHDLEVLKQQGVELAIFPEAFLTGYCVESTEEAKNISIAKNSEAIHVLHQASIRLDMIVVAGFAEAADEGLYNTAVLLEPGKEPRFYRKSHLPELGLDKFVCQGHGALEVFETRIGKIGILICFDMRFPEASRVLALKGAELLILPTNWPDGAQVTADYIAVARAAENRIYVATCDRVGEENGFKFIGKSKIIDPRGTVLASAGGIEEMIIADVDLAFAREKRVVTIPGKYETETLKARRPDLYTELTRDLSG